MSFKFRRKRAFEHCPGDAVVPGTSATFLMLMAILFGVGYAIKHWWLPFWRSF